MQGAGELEDVHPHGGVAHEVDEQHGQEDDEDGAVPAGAQRVQLARGPRQADQHHEGDDRDDGQQGHVAAYLEQLHTKPPVRAVKQGADSAPKTTVTQNQ